MTTTRRATRPVGQLELHSHSWISGPNVGSEYKNGLYQGSKRVVHSHEGGSVPHSHPDTGPAFFGYGWSRGEASKRTVKPTGQQLEYIAATEEESTFELVITDSAKFGGTIPIGDTPVDQLVMPAAERVKGGFRMKCIVRDERAKKSPRGAA